MQSLIPASAESCKLLAAVSPKKGFWLGSLAMDAAGQQHLAWFLRHWGLNFGICHVLLSVGGKGGICWLLSLPQPLPEEIGSGGSPPAAGLARRGKGQSCHRSKVQAEQKARATTVSLWQDTSPSPTCYNRRWKQKAGCCSWLLPLSRSAREKAISNQHVRTIHLLLSARP